MNNDIFQALEVLEKEKGIPIGFMIDKIKKAIVVACKSNYEGNDEVIINIDPFESIFDVYLVKTVVCELTNNGKEILLEEARKIEPLANIGDKVQIKLDTKEFGRIAAQTARNMIRQGIKDGEREQTLKEFNQYLGKMVTAVVDRVNYRSKTAVIKFDDIITILPKSAQLPWDNFREGDKIKVYIAEVTETTKGPKIIISRTHPDILKKFFEREVPEISEGLVEIKAVAREAGLRSKVAVISHDENIEAVGACIGTRGVRIHSIGESLDGEKIDVVEYNEDPIVFIAEALSPARVGAVDIIDPEKRLSRVIVNNDQLSLAIGNKGQNVRLASRLTGWKIDIISESELQEGDDYQYGEEAEIQNSEKEIVEESSSTREKQ